MRGRARRGEPRRARCRSRSPPAGCRGGRAGVGAGLRAERNAGVVGVRGGAEPRPRRCCRGRSVCGADPPAPTAPAGSSLCAGRRAPGGSWRRRARARRVSVGRRDRRGRRERRFADAEAGRRGRPAPQRTYPWCGSCERPALPALPPGVCVTERQRSWASRSDVFPKLLVTLKNSVWRTTRKFFSVLISQKERTGAKR